MNTAPKTARDYKGNIKPVPHPKGGKLIWTDGESITLWRLPRSDWVVVYGLDARTWRTYDAAAGALGRAILHMAQCEGRG